VDQLLQVEAEAVPRGPDDDVGAGTGLSRHVSARIGQGGVGRVILCGHAELLLGRGGQPGGPSRAGVDFQGTRTGPERQKSSQPSGQQKSTIEGGRTKPDLGGRRYRGIQAHGFRISSAAAPSKEIHR